MSNEERRHGRIVVGIDGSPSSIRALKWALSQAEAVGATVEAVHSWQVPVNYGAVAVMMPSETFAEGAADMLRESVAEATGGEERVSVERLVAEGHPAAVLLDRAKEADLVVVGNRGHGGFVGAILGSVSQHVIHHATCPVVVIPENA
ncbi:universal stress protein [Glycomyces tarimensis]